jgi:hypothetical protein
MFKKNKSLMILTSVFAFLSSCTNSKVEILEQMPNTGLDKPSLKLVENTSDSCIAILSLGEKNTGGYTVSGLRYEGKNLFVQNDKPQGMAVMMMSTPGAKLRFTPCPKDVENINVYLN